MGQRKHSEGLKKQIIRECKGTKRIGVVANQYGISSMTINKWIREERDRKASLQDEANRISVIEKQLKEVIKQKQSYEARIQNLVAKLYDENYRTKILLEAIQNVLDARQLDPGIKSMLEEAAAKAQKRTHREEHITK